MSFNNPYNLPHNKRAITPKVDFNTGINIDMSKSRRRRKQARHRNNQEQRLMNSLPASQSRRK